MCTVIIENITVYMEGITKESSLVQKGVPITLLDGLSTTDLAIFSSVSLQNEGNYFPKFLRAEVKTL